MFLGLSTGLLVLMLVVGLAFAARSALQDKAAVDQNLAFATAAQEFVLAEERLRHERQAISTAFFPATPDAAEVAEIARLHARSRAARDAIAVLPGAGLFDRPAFARVRDRYQALLARLLVALRSPKALRPEGIEQEWGAGINALAAAAEDK